MKILYLSYIIIVKYVQYYPFFFNKLLSFFFCLYYLLEYTFLFKIKNKDIYFFFLYQYIRKEISFFLSRQNVFYIIKNNKKIKNKKNKNIILNYKKFLYYYYGRRRMYYGLTVVYIQMFFRLIKEKKNFIKYMYFYKFKRMYSNSKKKIISYSISLFFFLNYNLIFFLEYSKKSIINLYFIFCFIKLYIKVKIKDYISLR